MGVCYPCVVSRAADLNQLDELLLRFVRAVRRPSYLNRILQGASGIPGAQALRVLRSVELREQRGERTSIRDVAADLEIEQSTASRAVNAIVDLELVSRSTDPSDQRRTLLSLTPEGHAALTLASRNRMSVIAEVSARWTAAEIQLFTRMLEQLVVQYETVDAPDAGLHLHA